MTGDITWHQGALSVEARAELLGHRGSVVWLTGLSGSGKSTVAAAVEERLVRDGRPAVVLDGDNLRHGLCADLGFDEVSRRENIRRAGEVALLFAASGSVALVPLISPYRSGREAVRERVADAGLPFVEVFVDTPIEECERRDPKGLYARARAGEIEHFTGVSDPYEAPPSPELVLRPSDGDAEAHADRILALLDSPGAGAAEG